jgi:CBS domain-containing protein
MTTDPFSVRTDDAVEKAARLIAEKHHNHLPVTDGDGKVAGMLTRADVLAALVEG